MLILLYYLIHNFLFFFFSSRRRHTRLQRDWSSDVCSSDLLVWRQAHGLKNDISLAHALSPSFLADRTDRAATAARALGHQLVSPRDWLLLAVAVAALERDPRWLAPPALVGVGYAFWIWANWGDTMDLQFRLQTSGSRVVVPTVLLAG